MRRLAIALMLVIALPVAQAQLAGGMLTTHTPMIEDTRLQPGEPLTAVIEVDFGCASAVDARLVPVLDVNVDAADALSVAIEPTHELPRERCINQHNFEASYALTGTVDAVLPAYSILPVRVDFVPVDDGESIAPVNVASVQFQLVAGLVPGAIELASPTGPVAVGKTGAIPISYTNQFNGALQATPTIVDGPRHLEIESIVLEPFTDAAVVEATIHATTSDWRGGPVTIEWQITDPVTGDVVHDAITMHATVDNTATIFDAQVPSPALAPLALALLGLVAARRR